ncbi:hypothetical protein HYX14_05825 [Candidatus Woesearchaeota archaeon]|nr:hypothetical protein [Candidatus Woesearchaeota archaeon]
MTMQEYELLPHQLLEDLKYDVEALKKKLVQPDAKAEELILEIESLKDSIHELTSVFQKALEMTKDEDATLSLKSINQKLDSVLSQNETIAKGMIAVSDKVDVFVSQAAGVPSASALARPVMHTMGAPAMPGMRMAPPPEMPGMRPSLEMETPPPPPSAKKRVGIFR